MMVWSGLSSLPQVRVGAEDSLSESLLGSSIDSLVLFSLLFLADKSCAIGDLLQLQYSAWRSTMNHKAGGVLK